MDDLWRLLSALSALGLVGCYLSGALSLFGQQFSPFALVVGLGALHLISILAASFFMKDYSSKEFFDRVWYQGPVWLGYLVKLSMLLTMFAFAALVLKVPKPPLAWFFSVFYVHSLAVFVALSPGGVIREGQPTPPPEVPKPSDRVRPMLPFFCFLTGLTILAEFSLQVYSAANDLSLQAFQQPAACLLFALYAPACHLANGAAQDQPSQNFWKVATSGCPSLLKRMLAIQAVAAAVLALEFGQGIFMAPFNQVSLAVYISRMRDGCDQARP
jgi:hypothetical protein